MEESPPLEFDLGVITRCVRCAMQTWNDVAIAVMWCSGQGMEGEVSEEGDGVAVERLRGDVLNVSCAVKLLPNWDDEKFCKIKIR